VEDLEPSSLAVATSLSAYKAITGRYPGGPAIREEGTFYGGMSDTEIAFVEELAKRKLSLRMRPVATRAADGYDRVRSQALIDEDAALDPGGSP
jgi:hypothetical protein